MVTIYWLDKYDDGWVPTKVIAMQIVHIIRFPLLILSKKTPPSNCRWMVIKLGQ